MTSWATVSAAVRRGKRLPVEDSWNNGTRRTLEDAAASGPQVDTGYETSRRPGFTGTKAESVLK